MRFSWQNLSNPTDNLLGIVRHGRAWLRRETQTPSRHDGLIARLEWAMGSLWDITRVRFQVDNVDGEATFSLGVPGAGVYLSVPVPAIVLEHLPFHDRREWGGDHRSLGIEVTTDGVVRWSIWADDHQHRRDDPRWMYGSWDVVKTLLGPARVKVVELEQRRVEIGLPERTYSGVATLARYTWKRPRAPWITEEVDRVRIALDVPIPIPGKGENDYDQDDDAIEEGSYNAPTIHQGVELLVRSVIRDRMERSGTVAYPTTAH